MSALRQSLKRGIAELGSRRMYLYGMIVVPLLMSLFFISLMAEGLPTRVPTAVVDLDQSPMSREMTRTLAAQQYVNVLYKCESYEEAMRLVRSGKVFGFYLIPDRFQKNTLSGQSANVDYYSNMTYFVPGTFSFKGYKSTAVYSAAAMVRDKATGQGLAPETANALVQPVNFVINGINNPWTNYSLYLTPSFLGGVIELMILLITVFSITYELKRGTSRQWLRTGDGSIVIALAGKLLPQTVIWICVTCATMALVFSLGGFIIACPLWQMLLAVPLFVVATQAMGVFIASVLPNPRFALAISSLLGILALSLCAFSFPLESMYGALRAFAYIYPERYFFNIHINCALNGWSLYYCRWSVCALLLFPLFAALLLPRLKRAMRRCIYTP